MPAIGRAQRIVNIDGAAGTAMYRFDGDLAKLEFLKYDVTNLAYIIRNQGRSAVIGVGGGRDLLSAHLFGFDDVTGVELNPIFVDWLTQQFRNYNHLADLPGTIFFVDEARSWFARHHRTLRPDPNEPDRHLGGHRRRRFLAVGERAVHRSGLAAFPRMP